MFKTTKQHAQYWKDRKIDWDVAYGSGPGAWNHTHRLMIIEAIKRMGLGSICEVGCAGGANLLLISRVFPHIQVGGADINPDAIEAARKILPPGSVLDVKPATDLFFSDKCADAALSDAVMIYHGPRSIRKAIREMKRVSRRHLIFVEFHNTSWLKRVALWLATGYSAYNWKKLLASEDLHDIEIKKIPANLWPGTPWEQWGYLITARV